jgi:membrane-associated phospholipid phosphatase
MIFLVCYYLVDHYNLSLFRLININGGIFTDFLMISVTQLGDGYFWVLFFLVVLLQNPKKGVTGIKTLLLLFIGTYILKEIFHFVRPAKVFDDLRILGPVYKYGGFPSGHSATIFAMAVIFSSWVPKRALVFFSVAGLCGLSRIYVGAHFPGDVVGGAYIGIMIGALSLLLPNYSGWLQRTKSVYSNTHSYCRL